MKYFLACPHRDPCSVNDQRVAALHNHHVFVQVMHMFSGSRGFTAAAPECNFGFRWPLEHGTFNPRCGLIGAGILLAGCFMMLDTFMSPDINALLQLTVANNCALRTPYRRSVSIYTRKLAH
jgi:hypothetical protein